ncbi:hypothetical protein ACFY2W_01855 [Streptomyces sp. NPDC001262]|uniref:hypothetical protein n=1 Tax=Streptomyces sp. NPDC001262 TaxID=3364552 RepID=UPI0036BA0147
MRSLRLIVAACVLAPVALTATACGPNNDKSNGKSDATATAAPTGAAAKALTQDQLVKALLPVKELQYDEHRSSLGPTKTEFRFTADKPACQPLLDLSDIRNAATPPPASATGAYYGTNGREYSVIQLTQFGTGQAAKAMTSAESALGSCAAFKATGSGHAATKVTFSKAAFKAKGDATLGLMATFSSPECGEGVCETRSYVVVRTGDVITLVSNSALKDPGMPEEGIVDKQLDKLRTAAK